MSKLKKTAGAENIRAVVEHKIGPNKALLPKNQQQIEIPKFDLAEDIMAEQRKIIAIRRKSPRDPAPNQNEEDNLVIAEIVARDIEKLLRS